MLQENGVHRPLKPLATRSHPLQREAVLIPQLVKPSHDSAFLRVCIQVQDVNEKIGGDREIGDVKREASPHGFYGGLPDVLDLHRFERIVDCVGFDVAHDVLDDFDSL